MKNSTKFAAFAVMAVVLFSSCGQKPGDIDINDMPPPFGERGDGTGGDQFAMYFESGVKKIEGIFGPTADLISASEVSEWILNNQLTKDSEPSLTGYSNLYSLLKTFKPDEKAVRDIYKNFYEEYPNFPYWTDDPNDPDLWKYKLSDEDFDVIFTYDDAKVNERFASEYSIFYNGKLYSPAWVYTHSTEDYEAEGIPAELIEEKRETYGKIPFADEARKALDAKIIAYCKGKQ